MTQLRAAVRGDVGDHRIVRLDGVEDLATVDEIEAHVWRDGVDPVTLECSVEDAEERTIRVELGGVDGWLASVDLDGQSRRTFQLEYQVTFLDESVLTWPAGDPDIIIVRADHDPA